MASPVALAGVQTTPRLKLSEVSGLRLSLPPDTVRNWLRELSARAVQPGSSATFAGWVQGSLIKAWLSVLPW